MRTLRRPPNVHYVSAPDHSPNSGAPFLPIDTPPRYPRNGSYIPVARGLSFTAKLNGTSPVPHPYPPYVSPPEFPLAQPSQAGPPLVGTRIGYATNDYSPVSHWLVRSGRERQAPVPVGVSTFASSAAGYRRMRGRVVPSPMAVPQWWSITGRVVQ